MVNTYSTFLYGFEITQDTRNLKINEDDVFDVNVILDVGAFSLEGLRIKLSEALNKYCENNYSVNVDRTTNIITISCDNNFKIIASGSSVLPVIGFSSVDTALALSHSGNGGIGTYYVPQFWLQSYVPSTMLRKAASATVNKSASGRVQVQKFGTEKFMECNIKFITDIEQPNGSPIINNKNGVSDVLSFLNYIIDKKPLEFIPDNTNKTNYEEFILESSGEDDSGTGFKLNELYSNGLVGYYETGVLKFRKIERD